MSSAPRHSRPLPLAMVPAVLILVLSLTSCSKNGTVDKPESTDAAATSDTAQISPIASVLVRRAERAKNAGAYPTALKISGMITEEAPSFAYGHFLRGQILTQLNRYDEAQKAFQKVLELDPDFPAIRFTLGNNAVQRGRYREALEYYEAERTTALPEDSLIQQRATLLQMGRVHKELGNLEAALAAFQQAVDLDDEYAEAYSELGDVYQQQGDLEMALDARRNALELDPDNGEYAYFVGTLLLKLGRPAEAIEYLEQAEEKRPWFYGIHYNLGRSLVTAGRTEEGERHLAIADSLETLDAQLGTARASAEMHNTPQQWLTYANMLAQAQRYEEAFEAYQVAQSLAPGDTTAAQAIRKLRQRLAGE